MIKNSTVLLSNGTRLVLAENKEKNQTYAEIFINFGGLVTKYKRNGKKYRVKAGLAHLLEHMLIENTKYGNMFDYLKEEYVEFNGKTSAFKTSFYIDTVYDFEAHLEELIRIVNEPVFDSDALEKVKKPIIEEIKRHKDQTYNKFSKKLNDCTYNGTKNRDTVGSEASVNSITIDELKEAHNVFYQPFNQTIYIVGNFDSKHITKVIENIYANMNLPELPYKLLDKKETTKVRHKRGHVVDAEFDEIINISFKVDISSLTPKEKVRLTFYLNHFLNYNFNDYSDAFLTLTRDNDTNYSIDRTSSFDIPNLCIIDLVMYGTNVKKFKNIVLDVFKNKYMDTEMFELWKKETLINLIVRNGRVYSRGRGFLDNIMTFKYYEEDTISDIEAFSIEDYQELLNKLDFSHYLIVNQTKE